MVKWPWLIEILQPPFEDEGIVADGQFEENLARHDKMIVPSGNLVGLAGFLVGTQQVHPAGDRLAGVLVDHGQFQLSAGGEEHSPQDCRQEHAAARMAVDPIGRDTCPRRCEVTMDITISRRRRSRRQVSRQRYRPR